MSSRLIHIVLHCRISILFQIEQYSVICMTFSLFFCWWTFRPWIYLLLWIVLHHMACWYVFRILFWVKYPESERWVMWKFRCWFFEDCLCCFHSDCTPLHSHQEYARFAFLHPRWLQLFLSIHSFICFDKSCSERYRLYPSVWHTCVWWLVILNTASHRCSAVCISSLRKEQLTSLASF